jgi:MFS family permease
MGNKRSDSLTAFQEAIRLQELLTNLGNGRIVALLILSFLVCTAFAPVFYFLKEYGQEIGVTNPGWFLTLSTLAEIGVRLFGGSLMDRVSKVKLLAGSLVWLTIGHLAMAVIREEAIFYGIGLYLGLGWGVCMPLLHGLVFDISEPRFRALNTNLSFEMFQAGFVAGPLFAGAILVYSGYAALFWACAAILAVSLASVPCLLRR